MSLSEDQLLARCQHGDKEAYGIIVNLYKERAYSIALGYVGSIDDAYDLSQEAFIRSYQNIKTFDLSKSFFNWFYQILKRVCLNYLRDNKTIFTEDAVEINDILSDNLTPVELSEQKETQKLVWAAIGKLSVEAKEIIILKEFKDMSYRDIATLLNIAEGTVMSRLYYARKSLKSIMEEVLA